MFIVSILKIIIKIQQKIKPDRKNNMLLQLFCIIARIYLYYNNARSIMTFSLNKLSGPEIFKELLEVANANAMTMNAMADKLGYPASTLSRWRDGLNPRLSTVMDLIKKLNKAGFDIEILNV